MYTFRTPQAASGTSGCVVISKINGKNANLSQQSNFYRQIRNFNIDISASTTDAMAGLHWQVGQATSLMYIAIFGSKKAGNNQRLMFTENGSSGFMVSSSIHLYIFLSTSIWGSFSPHCACSVASRRTPAHSTFFITSRDGWLLISLTVECRFLQWQIRTVYVYLE